MILAGCTVAGNAAATGAGISSSGSVRKLTLSNCIVSTNLAVLSGGGISNSGSLTLTYCTVSGNRAVKGAGIYNSDFSFKGSVAMSDCTISGNTATSSGGGIYNLAALSLTNCTVYGNDAFATNPGYGGGIFNDTKNYPAITPTVTNCTITGNAAGLSGGTGGNILNIPGSNFTLNNSIVAYSLNTGRDIAGVVSGNNNIVDDSGAAGGLSFANGNLFEAPGLTKLGYYGGPTETMVPAQGSPAIDNGDNALIPAGVTTDQRGAPRINGLAVDIGAVESGRFDIVVTTLADQDDGTIDPALGPGTTLREAINFANADPYTDNTISFAPGLAGTIALSMGALPAISTNLLTIAGPGANVLTVSGGGSSGILSITSGSSATGAGITISGLTLGDGSAASGGAVVNAGTLALSACALTDDSATSAGGGVDNTGTLTLTDCTLSGDTAANQGGGIYNYKGAVTLSNCTLSGNTAHYGGAIYDLLATVTLANCTVASNSAFFMGGIDAPSSGSMNLFNTIVAGNSGVISPVRSQATITSSRARIGIGSFTTGVDGNIVGVNPMLGPLAYNGGPTETMALLPGSPAINAGDSTIPGGTALSAAYSTDQRGAQRIKAAAVDIGAFEYGPQIIFVTSLADSGSSGITLRDALDFVDNIDPSGGDTITFAPGLTGTITLTQGMLPSGAANYAIEGPGANLLTIDAQNNSGILAIPSGSIVNLTGLTLANGSAMYGGAILNSWHAVRERLHGLGQPGHWRGGRHLERWHAHDGQLHHVGQCGGQRRRHCELRYCDAHGLHRVRQFGGHDVRVPGRWRWHLQL